MTDRNCDHCPTLAETRRALVEADLDADRARAIAVALEQENAELERAKAELHQLAEARATNISRLYATLNNFAKAQADAEDRARNIRYLLADQRDENSRLRAEAHAAHGVIEQAGLLQEHYATGPHWEIAGQLAHVLNGATWDEVREAHDG